MSKETTVGTGKVEDDYDIKLDINKSKFITRLSLLLSFLIPTLIYFWRVSN